VTAAFQRLARALLSPLLGWLSTRFDELRARLDVLVDGQAEATRLHRQAVQERDDGLDVVSRAVGVQAATLESIRVEQARLAAEVRSLRDEVRSWEPARDHVAD
jgi:hypothetical protein